MAAEPEAVLEAAIQKMVQDAKGAALARAAGGGSGAGASGSVGSSGAAAAPPFVPSAKFAGRRGGYVFTTRRQGTGYYLDPRQPPPSGSGGADGAAGGDDASGGGGDGRRAQQQQRQQQPGAEELLRRAEEEANIDEVAQLDARALRRLAAALERKARDNLELRLKHASEPLRFLESEVDLLALVREIGQVAGSPELYPALIDGPALPALLGLLAHENADLAAEVADLLQELTDADAVEDSADEAAALVEALLAHNGLELLYQALARFDEANEDEAAAVNKTLAVFEHLAEISPAVAEAAFERTELLPWLLARVKRRSADSNRLYASELLAVFVTGHEANAAALGRAGGVDALLVSAAPYKSRDPQDDEEAEYLENVFDALCCALMLPANRALFVEAEGVELMHILLKAKRASRYGAVRALDFACTRCPAACDRLIELGGLSPLFGLFMGRAKVKGPKGAGGRKAPADAAREVEERTVSLISSLLQHAPRAGARARVAAKFVEAEYEKADMLCELLFRYEDSVAAAEARLAPRYEAGELDEADVAAEQLDAGLFTLQGCVVIAAALWATGDAGLRKRLLALLHQRGRTLDMLREYLFDYYVSLGDDDGGGGSGDAAAGGSKSAAAAGATVDGAAHRARLLELLAAIDVDTDAAEAERARRRGGGDAAAAAAEAEGGGDGKGVGDAGAAAAIDVDGERPDANRRGGEAAAAPEAAAAARGRDGEERGSGGRRERSRSRERSRERERSSRSRSRSRSRERRRDRSRERERHRRSPDGRRR